VPGLQTLEAVNPVTGQVTVEMLVKVAKNCSQIVLDSEVDDHDPTNLAVAVTETRKPRFKAIEMNDPAGHFKATLIRVAEVVTLKENRPQIEVVDPRQIDVVEKDKQPDEPLARGKFSFTPSNRMTTGVFAWMLCRRPFGR
jgi:hypothetical protein